MSLLYTGDKAFEETEDWTIQNDEWGVDRLTRTFSGALPLLGAFLATVQKGNTDTEFPSFAVTNYSVQGHRSFPTVTVDYAGLWNDELPKPLITVSTELQEALIPFAPSPFSLAIRYYSRTARFRYVSRKVPQGRRYDGVMPGGVRYIEIVDARAAIGDISQSLPPAEAKSLVASGLARVVVTTTGPDYEPVGKLFEVEEKSTEYLIPTSFSIQRKIGSGSSEPEGESSGGFGLENIFGSAV